MNVNLAFIDYILSSSVLPVIVLMSTYRFTFQIVLLFIPTFSVRLVFVQSILTVLLKYVVQLVVIRWFSVFKPSSVVV